MKLLSFISKKIKGTEDDAKVIDDVAVWPEKSLVYQSHHFDSEAWSVVDDRDDDIIVATAYKSGTTWMQTIIAQLVHNGEPSTSVAEVSPWVDLRVPPPEIKAQICNSQTHRRILKTHLPTDAIHYKATAKYIYVARDARDAFMSLMNHYKKGNEMFYGALNGPGLVGEPLPKFEEVFPEMKEEDDKTRAIFDKWLSTGWGAHTWEEDGWPFWSYFTNFNSWWKVRTLPNVLFVHFNDLKSDLPGQIRRIAEFIGNVDIDDEKIQEYAKACTFDSMKQNAEKYAPLNGALWEGGATTFIHKGTNNRWKGVLTEEQVTRFETMANKKLGEDAFQWSAQGGNI